VLELGYGVLPLLERSESELLLFGAFASFDRFEVWYQSLSHQTVRKVQASMQST